MSRYRLIFNGVERDVARLHVNSISTIFRLERTGIILVDTDNFVCEWDDILEVFEGVDTATQPFTVEGMPNRSSTIAAQSPSFASQNIVSSPRSSRPPAPLHSYGLGPSPLSGARPPVTTPGVRSSRRRSSPTPYQSPNSDPDSRILKVYKGERGPHGRPINRLQIVHIKISADECSVPMINEKLQESTGFDGLVICDVAGAVIVDDDYTKAPEYWGFGRAAAANARKYFALPPLPAIDVANQSDSATLSTVRLPDEEVKRIAQAVVRASHEEPIKQLLKCIVCSDCAKNPAVCTKCTRIVGCYDCLVLWFHTNNESELDGTDELAVPGDDSNHQQCPLCRADWDPNVAEALNFFPLKGFEALHSFYFA
uniref:RING-type domain-containing protein n=1 Tax=Plectus sambesii TaxID=2011161 RepID=A0A914WR62_9BILA